LIIIAGLKKQLQISFEPTSCLLPALSLTGG
jgi:hypothetical protein